MTLQQFEIQYGHQKPYFEYWFGVPVQKAMPTWLHSLLQKIIIRLLDDAGYVSGGEVKLRISEDFQPLPDVTAVRPGQVELPYPTRPVEVVVEILSRDDEISQVVEKCRFYSGLSIPQIFVVDPETREAWSWDSDETLVSTDYLAGVPISAIWQELDQSIAPRS